MPRSRSKERIELYVGVLKLRSFAASQEALGGEWRVLWEASNKLYALLSPAERKLLREEGWG